jgi:hypothetical protein
VKTFRDAYCAERACDGAAFEHEIFWQCLPLRARVLAPFVAVMSEDHFLPDREFIKHVGGVGTPEQLNAEIRDFVSDYRNTTWLRRRAKVRISVKRLRSLTRNYLGSGGQRGAAMR